MTPLVAALSTTLATMLAAFFLLWIVGTALRDVSIVDAFWGIGFVVVVWQTFAVYGNGRARPLLLAVLVTIWGVRLAAYILRRNWGHGEDRRYTAMRQPRAAQFWWISLFMVFWLQAVMLWFLAWPLVVSASASAGPSLGWLDAVGLSLWLVGFFFEAVGDWQLARFKANPANRYRVMDAGMWQYTRHPNYFGECVLWWGVFLIACGDGAWWTILSPVLLTFLLLHVSGVAMLEADIADRRPDYARYKRTVNAFVPGPRRAASSD